MIGERLKPDAAQTPEENKNKYEQQQQQPSVTPVGDSCCGRTHPAAADCAARHHSQAAALSPEHHRTQVASRRRLELEHHTLPASHHSPRSRAAAVGQHTAPAEADPVRTSRDVARDGAVAVAAVVAGIPAAGTPVAARTLARAVVGAVEVRCSPAAWADDSRRHSQGHHPADSHRVVQGRDLHILAAHILLEKEKELLLRVRVPRGVAVAVAVSRGGLRAWRQGSTCP